MEHTPSEAISWRPAPDRHFTGKAWFGPLAESEDPEGLYVLGVLFEPGARTDWHHHPEGQILHVSSGAGFVHNRGGETAGISAGDVISIPAGETIGTERPPTPT